MFFSFYFSVPPRPLLLKQSTATLTAASPHLFLNSKKTTKERAAPAAQRSPPAASLGPLRSSHHRAPVIQSQSLQPDFCQSVFQRGGTEHQSLSVWYKSAFSAVINNVSEPVFLYFFCFPLRHSRAVWPNCFSPHASYSGRSAECISSPLLLAKRNYLDKKGVIGILFYGSFSP